MNQKKRNLEKLTKDLHQTADSLGMPIDAGIFDTILALNALEIPTSASCEGHLDRGIAAPWVDIESPPTKQFSGLEAKAKEIWNKIQQKEDAGNHEEADVLMSEYRNVIKELRQSNLTASYPLVSLLEKFYQNHSSPLLDHLILTSIGFHLRLQSQGAFFQDILSEDENKKKLLGYQKEIQEFTDFLKNEYLHM